MVGVSFGQKEGERGRMNSPLTEFDEEEYAKMLREEGYKEGYEEIRRK